MTDTVKDPEMVPVPAEDLPAGQAGKEYNSKKAWAVAFAIFFTGVALAWGQNMILPIVSILMVQLNVSAQVAGWLSTAGAIAGMALAFPAAGLVRKFGVRAVGLIAIITQIIAMVMGFLAPNEVVLLVSRIILGISIGLIGVQAPSIVSMWFPIDKRSAPMGLWASWQVWAVAGTYMFTGVILGPNAEWKNMFYVGFVLLAIALVLYIVLVRGPKGNEANFADVESSGVSIIGVFKEPSVYLISIGGIGFGIAVGVFCGWIPTYWAANGVMDLLVGNSAIGWIYTGEIFACIFGGILLNKIKKRKKFAAIVALLYALTLFAAYEVNFFAGAVVICIAYFVFEGAFATCMWALLPNTVKDPRLVGGAIAFFNVCNNFGMMLGVPIAGAILDNTFFLNGDMMGFVYCSIFAGICQLIAAVTFWVMKLYNEKGEVMDI